MKKIATLACAALLAAGPALAQDWPTRTVTVVVGFGAGSTPDLLARLIADGLQEKLGQPFVVDNRPGAGGNIGLDAVAKAEPDGYTLGVTIPGPLIVNPMRMELMYDPEEDIRPVTMLGTQPSVLAVNAELGVDTLDELLDLLRADPGGYNYASIGVGSISQLAMEMVALASGTEIEHIPYTSSPEAVQAVIGGEAQMATMPPLAVLSQAEEGTLKLLAQTSAERMPIVADVPTFAELGIEGVQAEAWNALVTTAGTPDAVVDTLYAALAELLSDPEMQERISGLGFAPVQMTPAEFEARIAEETPRWRSVLEAAGLLNE
ncbi:tripartite tricarboxylate transporter substrate binding protein [Pararhodobacter sp. SW119]|uniref:Bug family tripartite tricarboxylate transporter substrate binding protein n=1 Tax=Pararhodobacter sp. SW119 TaxID=2780075 RepID=UPI001AE092D6|nr:tripartite tricarboxylate transporter substrate binding protein [Pararhodobacter sp. SW119]